MEKLAPIFFLSSVKSLDMNKYGCQESTQKFALFT